MAYRRRQSYSGSRYRSTFNHGAEAAKKHIEEARKLSRQLGGTDQDVKDYFFNLPKDQLKVILDEYEAKHGTNPRQYAEETLWKWRSGRTKMSGLVAGRLFELLPKHMPVEKKFSLVESLWKHCGSTSSKTFFVGPEATPGELAEKVRGQLEEVVRSYMISEKIITRFNWLAETDSNLCQQLQNHFLSLEKKIIAQASIDRISALLTNIQASSDGINKTLSQTFEVGKHSVKLIFDRRVAGVSDKLPPAPNPTYSCSQPQSSEWGCLILLAIPLGFLFFLILT